MVFALRLFEALQQHDFDVKIDTRSLPSLEDWRRELLSFIRESDGVIFIVSPASVTSKVCAWEVEQVVALKKRLAPLILQPVEDDRLPDDLAKINYLRFDDPDLFDAQVEKLAVALRSDQAWVKEHTRLGELARRWDERGRPSAQLLRGRELEDAERWIAARPRLAPEPTAGHADLIRLSRRESRRRGRRMVGVVSAIAVVAIGLAAWANESRQEAERQARLALEQAEKARALFSAAKGATDGLILHVARGTRTLVGVPQDSIRTVLEKAEQVMDVMISATGSPDELLPIRANLLAEFAKTYWFLGDIQRTERYASQGIELTGQLAPDAGGSDEILALRSDLLHMKGDALRQIVRDEAALVPFNEALALRQALVARRPHDPKAWHRLCETRDRIGDVLRTNGKFDEAMAHYRFSETIRLDFLKQNPQDSDWLEDLSWSHNRLGDNISKTTDHHAFRIFLKEFQAFVVTDEEWSSALAHYEAGAAIRRKLYNAEPGSSKRKRDYAWSINLIGMAHTNLGKSAAGLDFHKQAMAILEEILAGDPKNTEWLRDQALTYNYMGDVLFSDRQIEPAFEQYRSSIAIREKLLALDKRNSRWMRDLFHAHHRISRIYESLGDRANFDAHRALVEQLAPDVFRAFPQDPVLSSLAGIQR